MSLKIINLVTTQKFLEIILFCCGSKSCEFSSKSGICDQNLRIFVKIRILKNWISRQNFAHFLEKSGFYDKILHIFEKNRNFTRHCEICAFSWNSDVRNPKMMQNNRCYLFLGFSFSSILFLFLHSSGGFTLEQGQVRNQSETSKNFSWNSTPETSK